MNRIAILVDVQNVYYTTRETFGRQYNYRKLYEELSQRGDIQHAYAYATDRNDPGQQKFQAAIRQIGFEVKLKPYIQRRDGSAKGDWDVGITIDALEAASEIDTLVLLFGDGDFDLLLKKLRERYGVWTEVRGVANLTAQSLIDSADVFRPIEREDLL